MEERHKLLHEVPHINFTTLFPGTFSFLSQRAWELNFNHGEMACVDNCITGFLRLRRDLRANNRP